ncbi:MAG: LutB/LldF family L-lactate oxidation iron-sulfur protein [Actinomycetaceae bacterium]|nr:LutB/LldF family L-lactate oxidation iron-sulfur protein [Actinomycetaceae bacterium]MDY6082608.1 LutB/LldF family L-lactate oxidation iron-sulfur protein [Actinomycetaceae bacterium]
MRVLQHREGLRHRGASGHAAQESPEEDVGWTPGIHPPEDPLRWGDPFPKAAHAMLQDTQMRRNLKYATGTIKAKRQMRVDETPDWEDLRQAASEIKNYTMAHLPELLDQMERNVRARGGIVHWARDATEANEIIYNIVASKHVDEVVKVKSMVTQEINMNEYLAERGISAWETDLAEMIVQLADDMPSHIVVPAIHRNRSEVKAIFEARMGDAGKLDDDPRRLTMAARAHLRDKFLHAKVAISGSNMMIAESGTLSIFESEGNGRMCLTLPETLISVVGIEKIVPRYQDAEVFAQLLPRSATGERMNPYTSFFTGVTPSDGPQEFHLVLVDNGRSDVLADPVGHQMLNCIRCGACMNTCPVYTHTSGHAYGSVYPGPMGIALTPQLAQAWDHNDPDSQMPFACSICHACADACPVKIPLPEIIIDNRKRYTDYNHGHHTIPTGWDIGMAAASKVMRDGKLFGEVINQGHMARPFAGAKQRFGFLPLPVLSAWTRNRDVPAPPAETFRQWWEREGKEAHPEASTGKGTNPVGKGAGPSEDQRTASAHNHNDQGSHVTQSRVATSGVSVASAVSGQEGEQ